LAYRLGSQASQVGPAFGFSLGGALEHRYLTLSAPPPAPSIELGVAIDFLFDQFSTGNVEQSTTSRRTLTATSFGALQTLGTRAGPFRWWIGAGGGLAVGFFSTPEVALRPGSNTAFQPFARGVVGWEIAVKEQVTIGLRAGYTFKLTSPTYTTDTGQTFHLFGDVLDIHAGLFYRFR
jgi:hypothetical protein